MLSRVPWGCHCRVLCGVAGQWEGCGGAQQVMAGSSVSPVCRTQCLAGLPRAVAGLSPVGVCVLPLLLPPSMGCSEHTIYHLGLQRPWAQLLWTARG